MLSGHSILEFRMCNVGLGKEGAEFAQRLANLLGCRVKVFTEEIHPYGGQYRTRILPAKYEIYEPNLEK